MILVAHLGVIALPHQPLIGLNLCGGAAALWLMVLDMHTTGGPWAIWPIAVWFAIFAMHLGLTLVPQSPWLGIWIGGGLVLSIGLVVIDRTTPGGPGRSLVVLAGGGVGDHQPDRNSAQRGPARHRGLRRLAARTLPRRLIVRRKSALGTHLYAHPDPLSGHTPPT